MHTIHYQIVDTSAKGTSGLETKDREVTSPKDEWPIVLYAYYSLSNCKCADSQCQNEVHAQKYQIPNIVLDVVFFPC